MKPLAVILTLLLSAPLVAQQRAAIGTRCRAESCQEGAIYAAAIDTLWHLRQLPNTMPPRVFKWIYQVPFRDSVRPLPSPLAAFESITFGTSTLYDYWPDATVVDSVMAVAKDGHSLTPGGPLYVLGPIDWAGMDLVRLQIAEYPRHFDSGAQYFLWLSRGITGWYVSRLETGMQN